MKYPTILQIYLDSICNLKCRFCLYQKRTDIPNSFNPDNLVKLKSFIQHAQTIVISACGEPLLSPHFEYALAYIYSLNNRKELIAVTTNGTLLSADTYKMLEGHLADLTISLNAGTKQTYERDMVNGNWERTLEAIKSFRSAMNPKDKHKICLHMVAHAENFTEVSELSKLAKELNIGRVRVDQIMISNSDHKHLSLASVPEAYKQVTKENFNVTFGTDIRYVCLSPVNEFHVWADGRVAPCCYNGSMFLGNAYATSPEEVWNGQAYKQLRKHQSRQCMTCPKVTTFDDPNYHIYPSLREEMD